jgi:hypothetical protein
VFAIAQEVTRLLSEASDLKQQLADAELAGATAALPAATSAQASIPASPWSHTQQQQQQQLAGSLSSPRAAAAESSRSLSPLGGSSSRIASRQPSLHQQLSSNSPTGLRSPTLSRHISFHELQHDVAAGQVPGGAAAAAAAAAAFSLSPFSNASNAAGGAEQAAVPAAGRSRSFHESE